MQQALLFSSSDWVVVIFNVKVPNFLTRTFQKRFNYETEKPKFYE